MNRQAHAHYGQWPPLPDACHHAPERRMAALPGPLHPKGNVIKVNFGHGGSSVKGKAMKIRKNNPGARKSFRARMNCDNPGPKWKANYWSCRKW